MLRRLFHPTSTHGVVFLLAAIFATVALVLVLIAGGLALHTASFLRSSQATTGTVVGLEPHRSCESNSDHEQVCTTTYGPRVRFTTIDGQEITYVSRSRTNPPRYHEGEQVEIRYRPDDPQSARIYAFVDLWMAPVIVGGIGAIFGLLTVVLALIARKLRPEPEPSSGWQDPGTLR